MVVLQFGYDPDDPRGPHRVGHHAERRGRLHGHARPRHGARLVRVARRRRARAQVDADVDAPASREDEPWWSLIRLAFASPAAAGDGAGPGRPRPRQRGADEHARAPRAASGRGGSSPARSPPSTPPPARGDRGRRPPAGLSWRSLVAREVARRARGRRRRCGIARRAGGRARRRRAGGVVPARERRAAQASRARPSCPRRVVVGRGARRAAARGSRGPAGRSPQPPRAQRVDPLARAVVDGDPRRAAHTRATPRARAAQRSVTRRDRIEVGDELARARGARPVDRRVHHADERAVEPRPGARAARAPRRASSRSGRAHGRDAARNSAPSHPSPRRRARTRRLRSRCGVHAPNGFGCGGSAAARSRRARPEAICRGAPGRARRRAAKVVDDRSRSP